MARTDELADRCTTANNGQHGGQIAQLNGLWSRWLLTLPIEQNKAPFMFNAGLDAADDFNVSVFSAAHGYYREGISNLRSALEALTFAARFAQRQDTKGLNAWLNAEREPPKFGNARDILEPVLGRGVTDVLKALYKELSGYIHTGSGGSNSVLWDGSNGPVFVPDSFQKVYRCFRDVMGMGYVLLTVGWPMFSIPEYVLPLFETPDSAWTGIAVADVKSKFVTLRS